MVSFSASLLDKTSNPTWNCEWAVFGAWYIKYTSLCSHLPLSGIAIFRLLFYLRCSQSYILTYTSSGSICCPAFLLQYHQICHPTLLWSVAPLSLLPSWRKSYKHLLFLFLAWISFHCFWMSWPAVDQNLHWSLALPEGESTLLDNLEHAAAVMCLVHYNTSGGLVSRWRSCQSTQEHHYFKRGSLPTLELQTP